MNIQANKNNLAMRKMEILLPRVLDTGIYQKAKVIGAAAMQRVGQVQGALMQKENERQNQQAATDLAVQNAEGKGMEEAQKMEDERIAQAAQAQAKQKRSYVLPVPTAKSHLMRNALIAGGVASTTLVGGTLFLPLFFGNA